MRRRVTLQYVFAGIVSVAIFVLLYQTWRADLRFPCDPVHGDLTLYLATVFKGPLDNPWYSSNRYIGAPTGLDLRDYPMPDLLFHLWVKGAGLFTDNPFLIANLTLILSFPLVTLPSLFVLRRFGVRYSVALVASLLFSFASFHHLRGLVHVLYAVGYFTVPLATMLALDVFAGRSVLVEPGASRWHPRIVRSRTSLLAVAAALLIGLTGAIYFPFFSASLIFFAGICGALRQRTAMPLVRATVIVGIIGASLTANLAPSLVWVRAHGETNAVQRPPEDAERYGLKITQLVMPLADHRFEPFRRLMVKYDATAPLVTENRTAYLGMIGAFGFLYLTLTLVGASRTRGPPEKQETQVDGAQDPEVMQGLRALSLLAVLLGTIGGFGAIFAYLVSPQIRSYNRISTYILFCSLTALAILVERLARRARPLVVRALPVALVPLLVLGVLDQAPRMEPAYPAAKQEFLEQDRFIQEVESSIPKESMVFQLPYQAFPEGGPLFHLTDYDLLRPYLHSKTIHWSFGGMRGRRGDQWNKDMASRTAPEMVDALAEAGFAGILVSRDGYQDRALALEASLSTLLGPPLVANEETSFYPLKERAEKLHNVLGDGDFELRAQQVRTPIFFGWLRGFYPPRTLGGEEWSWSRPEGLFVLENPSSTARSVVFETALRTANGPATVKIEGDLFHMEARSDPDGSPFRTIVEVPPGEHFFRVRSDGKRIDKPGEGHDFYFEMRRPSIREVDATSRFSCQLGPGFIVPPEITLPLWGAGPRSKIFVYRKEAGDVRLVFRVEDSASSEQEVAIHANDADIGVIRPERGKEFAVDFSSVSGDNVVTLDYARWNHHPDEFAPRDERPFSVAFRRVSCESGDETRVIFP